MYVLTILGLTLALIAGYILWGVFFYAPLIGNGWTLALVGVSAFGILFGLLTTD